MSYLVAFLRSVRRLLVTANVVPRSQILVTLVMEALRSSETSDLTRATLRNIPEDGIFIVTAVKTSDHTPPIVFVNNFVHTTWLEIKLGEHSPCT
jgi:predicted hotdog family 3-hydroxylacyl-ACP dehydratase